MVQILVKYLLFDTFICSKQNQKKINIQFQKNEQIWRRERSIYFMTRQNQQTIQKLIYFRSSGICSDHRLVFCDMVSKKPLMAHLLVVSNLKNTFSFIEKQKSALAPPVVILDTLFVLPSPKTSLLRIFWNYFIVDSDWFKF